MGASLLPASKPRLLLDIDAQNARCAVETAAGDWQAEQHLAFADYPALEAALISYLQQQALYPQHAALSLACPIDGDSVVLPYSHGEGALQFSIEALRIALALDTLLVVNDFSALAQAIPRLPAAASVPLGAACSRSDAVIGVVGPGSGLGVSGLIPVAGRWVSLASEGGHVSFNPVFAPQTADEAAWVDFALSYLATPGSALTAEHLLSAQGLAWIDHALAADSNSLRQWPAIVCAAQAGEAQAARALNVFCSLLGRFMADVALTLGAVGGMYLTGELARACVDWLPQSPFRRSFEGHGRAPQQVHYLTQIPTFLLINPQANLIGLSTLLAEHLPDEGSDSLLLSIRRQVPNLSPAERRVAEQVLASPRRITEAPVSEIAKLASVSQPTVIRFCRSLGFEGLQDFKLGLAAGLVHSLPLRHTTVRSQAGIAVADMGIPFLQRLQQVQELLHALSPTLQVVAQRLQQAARIDLYLSPALPASLSLQLAQIMQHAGLPVVCASTVVDMSALADGVSLLISSAGQDATLCQRASSLRQSGQTIVVCCPRSSSLTALADYAFAFCAQAEDATIFLPCLLHALLACVPASTTLNALD